MCVGEGGTIKTTTKRHTKCVTTEKKSLTYMELDSQKEIRERANER